MNFLRQINTFLDEADEETTNAEPGEMPAMRAMPNLGNVSIGGAFGSMVGAASKVAGKAAKTAKAVQSELAQVVKLEDEEYEGNLRSETAELPADFSIPSHPAPAPSPLSSDLAPALPPVDSSLPREANSRASFSQFDFAPSPPPADSSPPLAASSRASFSQFDFSAPPPPAVNSSPSRAASSRASFSQFDFFTPPPAAVDTTLHSPPPLEYSTPLPAPATSTLLSPSPGSLPESPSGGMLSEPVDQTSMNESSWEKVDDAKVRSTVSSSSSDRVLEDYNAVEMKKKASDGWSKDPSLALPVRNSTEVDTAARVSMLEALTVRQQRELESAAERASTLDAALRAAQDDISSWRQKTSQLEQQQSEIDDAAEWKTKTEELTRTYQQAENDASSEIAFWKAELEQHKSQHQQERLTLDERLRAANDEITGLNKKLGCANVEHADALHAAQDETTAWQKKLEHVKLENAEALRMANDEITELAGRLKEQMQGQNGDENAASVAKFEAAEARAEEAERKLEDMQGRLQEQLQSQNGDMDAASAAKLETALRRAEEAERKVELLQDQLQNQNGEADAGVAAKIEAATARAEEAEKSLEDAHKRLGVMEEQLRHQNDGQPLATGRAEEAERLLAETRTQLSMLENDLAETQKGSLREIEQLHAMVQEEKRKGAVAQQQLETQLQAVTSERDHAQEQSKQMVEQLARLQKAMGDTESESAKLRDILEEQRSAAATLQKKVKTLESELKQKQSTSKVDEEVNKVREEMEHELNMIVQGKEKQIATLKQFIEARKQQESQLSKESEKMRKELEGARRELLEAKKHEEFLTQKHAREMEALLSDAATAAEKAALSGNQEGRDKAELQRNLRSMELVLQEEIEKLESANRDYSRQVLSLQAENDRLQGKQDELMQELTRVAADQADEKEKVVEDSSQVPILEAQVNQLQEKLNEAVQMRQIFQRDAEAYGKELQAVQTERRELEGQIDELHRRIDSNKAISTASSGYLAKIDEDAQNRISAQREEIEYLRQKNAEKTKRVEQLICEKNALVFEMRNKETPVGGDLEKQTLIEKESRVRMMNLSSTVHPILLSLDEVLRLGVRQLSQTPTLRIVFAVYLIVHHIFSLLLLQFGVG